MQDPKRLGNYTELQCATYLYGLGYSISIPFGDSEKYDLVLDIDGKLYKAQVKHSTEHCDNYGNPEFIQFKSYRQSHNTKEYKAVKYEEGEVDFFATFYNNHCYLIPFSSCNGAFHKVLRITKPKNNQKAKITMLEDYMAEKIISHLHS